MLPKEILWCPYVNNRLFGPCEGCGGVREEWACLPQMPLGSLDVLWDYCGIQTTGRVIGSFDHLKLDLWQGSQATIFSTGLIWQFLYKAVPVVMQTNLCNDKSTLPLCLSLSLICEQFISRLKCKGFQRYWLIFNDWLIICKLLPTVLYREVKHFM